jgi:transposase
MSRMRRRSVTRLLLWEEYRAANPDGFGYTWFCTTFEAWKQRARPSMRQTHIGGEKVFVDFAGDTIDIFDPITGEVRHEAVRRGDGGLELHLR